MNRTVVVAVVGAVVAVGVVGLFVVDFGAAEPDPVDFDETVAVGLTLEEERRLDAEQADAAIPRVQVFYSRYPYVVGYYGVEEFGAVNGENRHEQLFGYPLAVYVTGFGADADLTADGLPVTEAGTEWVRAADAFYVVGSDARAPGGPTVVPFAARSDAEAFTRAHGGAVRTWEGVLDEEFAVGDADGVRDGVDDHHRAADRRVANATALRDRPTSVVVGEDVPTVQAGVDAAPDDTTVVVPPGIYEETVELDRSITLAGQGARLVGDGNGTVVNVTADRAALVGVGIAGVGNETPGLVEADDGGHDHGSDGPAENETWDEAIEDDYGSGDAGIAVDGARDVLLAGVHVETPASGVMLRNSPGVVVRNVSVDGNRNRTAAHMGLVAMRSPGVVEGSSFTAGLDGVYTHRADGIVVRDNVMRDNRMGVHLMHTSGALLADNRITNESSTGIFVMTGPEGNGLVGNEIDASGTGIDVGGTDTYVADNVVRDNEVGVRIDATGSILADNVVVNNAVGVEAGAMLPTNRVVGNDFVANDDHATSSFGPLRVWTVDGRGNYWEGAVGRTDGAVLDRAYAPTDGVDGYLHRVDGTPTIAQAPALDALAGLEGAVSGLRSGEIRDNAPLCEPTNDEWFARSNRRPTRPTCGTDSANATD